MALLDSTLLYYGSTWLYFTLLSLNFTLFDSTSLYYSPTWITVHGSSWLSLLWLYLTLHHGSASLYYCCTWLYLKLRLLNFTHFDSSYSTFQRLYFSLLHTTIYYLAFTLLTLKVTRRTVSYPIAVFSVYCLTMFNHSLVPRPIRRIREWAWVRG